MGLLGGLRHNNGAALPLQVTVRLDAAAVPLMNGALHCSASGIASSLLSDNLKAAAAVANTDEAAKSKTWPLLFDPQTSGGLLAGCVLCIIHASHICFPHAVAALVCTACFVVAYLQEECSTK